MFRHANIKALAEGLDFVYACHRYNHFIMKVICAVVLLFALSAECRKFRSKEIKYKFTAIKDGDKAIIRSALNDVEGATCLKFVEDGNVNSGEFIDFKRGRSGCWSYVGARPNGNVINLSLGCYKKSIIQKELMHALGFVNEISRTDRNNYVRIMFNEVSPRFRHSFKQFHDKTMNEVTEYDYRSVLHYNSKAFSMKGKVTIQTLKPAFQNVIGNAEKISNLDAKKIKLNYC